MPLTFAAASGRRRARPRSRRRLDHVMVGEHVALGDDDHAGAEARRARSRPALGELREEPAQRSNRRAAGCASAPPCSCRCSPRPASPSAPRPRSCPRAARTPRRGAVASRRSTTLLPLPASAAAGRAAASTTTNSAREAQRAGLREEQPELAQHRRIQSGEFDHYRRARRALPQLTATRAASTALAERYASCCFGCAIRRLPTPGFRSTCSKSRIIRRFCNAPHGHRAKGRDGDRSDSEQATSGAS